MTTYESSSNGGGGIVADEGQRFGPEKLFSGGGESPTLDHGEPLTAAFAVTFLVTYDSYKNLCSMKIVMACSDSQPKSQRL